MNATDPPAAVTRPDPILTPDAAFFWEGAKRGELLGQRCADCGDLQHPPRPMCPKCHSVRREPVRLSGRGELYSWIIPRHPQPLGFAEPPVVALIQLDPLMSVEPGPGVVYFMMVVVLTMLAAHSFDPRLIWNPASLQRSEHG